EFLDPACETCAIFYPAVKQLMAANPGQIRLVLRWAPFHEGSRDVVALLEAARKQDQFWPALETLLASQRAWTANHQANVEAAWRQLGSLGLDRDQVVADMGASEVQQLIAQDLADAATMNVTMTPEYFVNGRPLPSFGWEQLQQLVNEALAEAR
ncbi:MAG: DsbA family protein, partial [Planctomycetota bacterium]